MLVLLLLLSLALNMMMMAMMVLQNGCWTPTELSGWQCYKLTMAMTWGALIA